MLFCTLLGVYLWSQVSRWCLVPPLAVIVRTNPAALATFSAVACSKALFHSTTLLLNVMQLKWSSGRRSCRIFKRASLVCSKEKTTTLNISTLITKLGVNLQHNKEIYYWQHTRCSPVPLFRPNSIFQLRPSEMANSPDLQTHKKHSQDGYRGLFCSPANLCTQFSIKEKWIN